MLEWVAILPSPRYLPNPGIELRSPALQAESLPSEPPGKSTSYYPRPKTVELANLKCLIFLDSLMSQTFLFRIHALLFFAK